MTGIDRRDATTPAASVLERVVIMGDLEALKPEERIFYYRQVCESLGLNPLTQPFEYIKLNNKLRLYAKKDCTDQLRKINGVSIIELTDDVKRDLYIVTAKARDKHGRIDAAKGVVSISGLRGEAAANAIMKAETKAKRRVTLSICGLGLLDETETGDMSYDVPAQADGPETVIPIESAIPPEDEPGPEQDRPHITHEINQDAKRHKMTHEELMALTKSYLKGKGTGAADYEDLRQLHMFLGDDEAVAQWRAERKV